MENFILKNATKEGTLTVFSGKLAREHMGNNFRYHMYMILIIYIWYC